MAKKFMFICFGILALAGAYAVGAGNSVAQVGGMGVAQVWFGNANMTVLVTDGGDFYARNGEITNNGFAGGPIYWSTPNAQWTYMGNCFSGAVNNQQNSLGGVKSLFR